MPIKRGEEFKPDDVSTCDWNIAIYNAMSKAIDHLKIYSDDNLHRQACREVVLRLKTMQNKLCKKHNFFVFKNGQIIRMDEQ